jgi:hypothetical protein
MSLSLPSPRTRAETIEREGEELLALWEKVGSQGLDTWHELPARYAIPGSSGGAGHDYSWLVEDYSATRDVVEESRDEEYETRLKRLFDRIRSWRCGRE